MAEKLLLYYKYVGDNYGLNAKIKLAQETKTPSTQAAIVLDTPEKIKEFKSAIEKITGQPAPNL